jgi:hypothetical protein
MAASFACRQLVGIGDGPPQGQGSTSTDAGAEAGFTYGQGDCATCVTTSCAPQATACAGTPSCAALEGCMSGCGTDATCRAQCGVDHGLGNDVATPAFEACLAGACGTACGLTCGGLAAVFPPATATGCEGCILKQECTATAACATDPLCQKALRCQFSSGTLDVWQACPAVPQDAGTAPLLPGPGAPVIGTCSSDCSWGADWSCVGKVSWPTPAPDPVTTTVFVYSSANALPIEGALVKLCDTNQPACTPPLAGPATTDDGGTAVLQRPAQAGGTFFVDVSSSAITPSLTFVVFPLSQPSATIPIVTVPEGELPSLANLAGVTLDPALGMILVVAVDCRLAPAPRVTFDLTPKGTSTLAYLVGANPVIGTTETDLSGTGVFANTIANMTLTLTVTTPQGPSAKVSVFARDGGISTVYAVPTSPP